MPPPPTTILHPPDAIAFLFAQKQFPSLYPSLNIGTNALSLECYPLPPPNCCRLRAPLPLSRPLRRAPNNPLPTHLPHSNPLLPDSRLPAILCPRRRQAHMVGNWRSDAAFRRCVGSYCGYGSRSVVGGRPDTVGLG